jgi:hypothetical protein
MLWRREMKKSLACKMTTILAKVLECLRRENTLSCEREKDMVALLSKFEYKV